MSMCIFGDIGFSHETSALVLCTHYSAIAKQPALCVFFGGGS